MDLFRQAARGSYRLKTTSFVISLLFHCDLVALLWVPSIAFLAPQSSRPIYDAEIRPHLNKIVWYRFKKGLPNIDSGSAPKTRRTTGGKVRSPQTIVAISNKNREKKQVIRTDSPAKPIERPIPSPNLVALAAPAPVAPKKFEPPSPQAKAVQQPRALNLPPVPDLNLTPSAASGLSDRPSERSFVPPPPSAAKPKLSLPRIPALEASAHLAQPSMGGPPLPDLLGRSAIPRPLPPPPSLPGSGGGMPDSQGNNAANSSINAIVIGTNPSDRLAASLPEGSRSAEISTAPKPGSGINGNGTAPTVGGLTTRGKSGATIDLGLPPPSLTEPSRTILYRNTISVPMPSTLSAPLRPSSRTIPAALEARFQNRTVYALAIPSPGLPEYSGYWTLWFAERNPSADDVVQMQAPVPLQKTNLVVKSDENQYSNVAVQVAVTIDQSGRVEPLGVIRGATGPKTQAVLNDIRTWLFKPALKNGKPVSVEAVLELTFRVGTAIASH